MNAEVEITRIQHARSHYDVLDLPKSCAIGDIKQKYKKLALLLHPDKCAIIGCEDAFKSVSSAYSCLSSPEDRRRFDQFGDNDDEGDRGHRAHFHSSNDIFEHFFREFFFARQNRQANPFGSSFFRDDYFDDEDDYDNGNYKHWGEFFSRTSTTRFAADWASVAPSNVQVNCFHCRKHLPKRDVRYNSEPFYQGSRYNVCRRCNAQFESLKPELIEKMRQFDEALQLDLVVFSIRLTKRTMDKLKPLLTRDKGWKLEEKTSNVVWAINSAANIGHPLGTEYNYLKVAESTVPLHGPGPAAGTGASQSSSRKTKKK